MYIHATSVDFFVAVKSADRIAAEQKLEQALSEIPMTEIEIQCEGDRLFNAVFKIRCVGPYAGEVMRVIEALES